MNLPTLIERADRGKRSRRFATCVQIPNASANSIATLHTTQLHVLEIPISNGNYEKVRTRRITSARGVTEIEFENGVDSNEPATP